MGVPPSLPRWKVRKTTNAAYRKLRGTDKPFSGSEEQTRAIWQEEIRKARYAYRKPDSSATGTA